MMWAEMVPEMLVICNQLTQVIAQEGFINASCYKSFILYSNI